MKNQVQLITYVDRLSGGGIADLHAVLKGALAGLFGGVHLLPFFHPIDGADAGFDPIDHTEVDSRLGDWGAIAALAREVDVMADVVVNHMSSGSPQFKDYSERGTLSACNGLFLTFDSVFPQGATERDLLAIYRPRPGLPLTMFTLKSGEKKILWTTFTSQQVDIDVRHPQGFVYLERILRTFSENGIRMIRVDAVGYAIKKAGTSCFMLPQTFDFIAEFAARARILGMEVLVEIHAHYQQQIDIAARVDWVYDFALPPLVLHAFFFKTARYLKQWMEIRPGNALTVLDTHDGIGIIDIGADMNDREAKPGLVPSDEIDRLVDMIHDNSGGESRHATGAAASNLDLYQVNCTFYDALARNDRAYWLARAIQFFVPGIPQVYYMGLLAGHNDMGLLARTGVGRDINRHYYRKEEVVQALEKPIVRDLVELVRFRNNHPAFAGRMQLGRTPDDVLVLEWRHGEHWAMLRVHFRDLAYDLTYSGGEGRLRPSFDRDPAAGGVADALRTVTHGTGAPDGRTNRK